MRFRFPVRRPDVRHKAKQLSANMAVTEADDRRVFPEIPLYLHSYLPTYYMPGIGLQEIRKVTKKTRESAFSLGTDGRYPKEKGLKQKSVFSVAKSLLYLTLNTISTGIHSPTRTVPFVVDHIGWGWVFDMPATSGPEQVRLKW